MRNRVLALLALSSLLACDGGTAPDPITQVTITPPSASLTAVGQTVQFTATAQTQGGDAAPDAEFTWTSLDPGVLSVDGTGLATALAAGTGRVRATVTGGQAAGEATVDVDQQITSVRLLAVPDSVLVGGGAQLTAEAADANGNVVANAVLTWQSSDADVLTVSTTGAVQGVARGAVEISVRAGTVTARDSIRVLRPNVAVARDTVLSGTVELRSLSVPENVTMTFDGDVLLDVEEAVTIAGGLVADCTPIRLLAGGAVTITGRVSTACSDDEATTRGDLTIAAGGELTVQDAEIESSGSVAFTNDVTLTGEDFPPIPDIDAEGGPGRIDALFAPMRLRVAMRRAVRQSHGAGARNADDGCRFEMYSPILLAQEIGGQGGVTGGPGGNGAVHVIRCAGTLQLVDAEVHATHGGPGGDAEVHDADDVDVRGGAGGEGADIVLQATGSVSVTGARLRAGNGGRGGDARAFAIAGGGTPQRAATARAEGGRGGRGGIVVLQAQGAVQSSNSEFVHGAGGRGGEAEASGGEGTDGTGAAGVAQAGGHAFATGGAGGSSLADAGAGGAATASGGIGADGSVDHPNGGSGGAMHAVGGRGGRGTVSLGANGRRGPGGRIFFKFGRGGKGRGECLAQGASGAGGHGGAGGRLTGEPGMFGAGAGDALAGGVEVDVATGNGGDGGDGIPFGQGGAAGEFDVTFQGAPDVTQPALRPGNNGSRCAAQPPSIASLEPGRVTAGSGGVLVAANGFFGSTADELGVTLAGTSLGVSTFSSNRIEFDVPGNLIGEAGVFPLVVSTPDGTSDPFDFFVDNPVPGVTGITPPRVLAGSGGGIEIQIDGTGFVRNSTVSLNGEDFETTFISPTQLTSTLTGAFDAGEHDLTVRNPEPGGGISAPFTLFIDNPVPVLTDVTPGQATVGSDDLLIQLSGSGFVPSSGVRFGGDPIATTFLSPTSLEATIPGNRLQGLGGDDILVFNPSPGGGESEPFFFPVTNPPPVISGVSPGNVLVGSSELDIIVTGTGFTQETNIFFNEQAVPTIFRSPTELEGTIPGTQLGTAGEFDIFVQGPPPGPPSEPFQLIIFNPTPQITGLTPPSATQGADDLLVTVSGSGFVPTSSVLFGGEPVPTTFQSGNSLTALFGFEGRAAGGVSVVVMNPGPQGGPSNDFLFNVTAPGPVIELTPSVLNAQHIVGPGECPQSIPGLVLRNNGPSSVSWGASINGDRLTVQPVGGSLPPGESRDLTVFFDCSAAESIQRTLTVTAFAPGAGSTTATATINLNMVFPQRPTRPRLDPPFPFRP